MIELINDLVISVDQYNYALQLRTNKFDKEGRMIYRPIGYHDTLTKAIKGAKNYSIKNELKEGSRSLEEAINIVNGITKEFEELLNRVLESEEV